MYLVNVKKNDSTIKSFKSSFDPRKYEANSAFSLHIVRVDGRYKEIKSLPTYNIFSVKNFINGK